MKHILTIILLLTVQSVHAQTPNWSVTPSQFEHSMNITGEVQLDPSDFASDDDIIAAFVGEEVRGLVKPIFTGGRWLFFLTTYAHQSGDTLRFRYYNAAADQESELLEHLVFEIGEVEGSVSAPFLWTKNTATSIEDDLPHHLLHQSSYPNPFTHSTTISYSLPNPAEVTVDVFDLLGRNVQNLVTGHAPAGEHKTVFEAGDLPNGIYIYRIEIEGYAVSKAITLIR